MADAATRQQMQAIAAGLGAAGLTARVHETAGVLDITATLGRRGERATEVIVDEDHYVEIRYWNPPGAAPGDVTAVITNALSAIAAALAT